MLRNFFTDLHIHVGVTEGGGWVKIPSSKNLTVRGIVAHAAERKGLEIVGVADAMSPGVLADLRQMQNEGVLTLDPQGGYHYSEAGGRVTTLLLGAEIETSEEEGGLAHTLIYLADMDLMAAFAREMSKHIKNINLSSQNARMPLKKLVSIAKNFEALIIPAHVFTPHKSVYGAAARRLTDLLPDDALKCISAIELGLSADSFMADRINELASFSFLTNSDAHSLAKIGREYNKLHLKSANFTEIALALARQDGRAVTANYGLNPRLGKYHRTLCLACGEVIAEKFDGQACPLCQSRQIIKGVLDRIDEIADRPLPEHPSHRGEYFYQVPLEFIPGLGPKSMSKLLDKFHTEMNILHFASNADLIETAGEKLAASIIAARDGTAQISDGGGGVYGKIV